MSACAVRDTDLGRSATDFRYAIDEGVERVIYLSGGTKQGPEAIRLLRNGIVVLERPAARLMPGTIDVCRNNPPQDRRWWSARIDDEIAAAIRQDDTTVYRLEALVDGGWQALRFHDSGCKWKGG